MKLILTMTLLLSGCATQGGFFAPTVASGNSSYVVIHDPFGLPGKAQQAAEAYCSSHGKVARFQSMGGNSYQCTSINYCSTYHCVN